MSHYSSRQAGPDRWTQRWVRRIALALLAAALATVWAVQALAFPRTLVDGVGRQVHLATPPQRIFSATLVTDNILLSIVDPARVVGVTAYAKDPFGSYVIDKVQPHMTIIEALSPELVIAARPDVVLVASWSSPDAVRQLQELGIPVYIFDAFDTVADAMENIRRVGEIAGEEEKAQALVDEFYAQVAQIEARVAGRPRPRVLSMNSWGNTTGLNTPLHDIIEMAGGINAAAEAGIVGWQEINPEAVIQLNPDVIVTESSEEFVERVLADSALQSVKAVREGRVYALDHTGALNHHFILAIRQLAELLHPEAF